MTIEEIIALGDGLKKLMPQTEGKPIGEAPRWVLPAGCPLYATMEDAGKVFCISVNTMRALIKNNADFPVLWLGKKILVDMPGLYEWLHNRNGERLETE